MIIPSLSALFAHAVFERTRDVRPSTRAVLGDEVREAAVFLRAPLSFQFLPIAHLELALGREFHVHVFIQRQLAVDAALEAAFTGFQVC